MTCFLVLAYGVLAYLLFLPTFLYAVGFFGNYLVPRSIDSGEPGPLPEALIVNTALLGLFAVQHSVMARSAFKRWWTRFIPAPIERSTYVLLTSLILILLFEAWRPMTTVVWSVESEALRNALHGLYFLGWGIVLYSTFLIDHFDLFGLRQVTLHFRGQPYTAPPFQMSSLYRWVRHPIMLGFLVAFWAAPDMTSGRFFFAAMTTAYVVIALHLEERTLLAGLGEPYREYRARVPMLLPVRSPAPRSLQPGAAASGGDAVGG